MEEKELVDVKENPWDEFSYDEDMDFKMPGQEVKEDEKEEEEEKEEVESKGGVGGKEEEKKDEENVDTGNEEGESKEKGKETDEDDGNSEKKELSEDKADEKSEEDSGEKEDISVDDVFKVDNDSESGEAVTDYSSLSKKIGIEASSESEFIEKYNESIENAKQEIKLDSYDPQAQKIIKHLHENGGDLKDFFMNEKIQDASRLLNMTAEDKYREYRAIQLSNQGVSDEDIDTRIDEEITSQLSTRDILDTANKIDSKLQEVINSEITKVTAGRDEYISKQNEKIERQVAIEKESMKQYVDKIDSFMGVPVKEDIKKMMKLEIDSGKFDNIVDQNKVGSKFFAYMHSKYGDSVLKYYKNEIKNKITSTKNETTDKYHKELRNLDDSKQKGVSRDKPSTKYKFGDAWKKEEGVFGEG